MLMHHTNSNVGLLLYALIKVRLRELLVPDAHPWLPADCVLVDRVRAAVSMVLVLEDLRKSMPIPMQHQPLNTGCQTLRHQLGLRLLPLLFAVLLGLRLQYLPSSSGPSPSASPDASS